MCLQTKFISPAAGPAVGLFVVVSRLQMIETFLINGRWGESAPASNKTLQAGKQALALSHILIFQFYRNEIYHKAVHRGLIMDQAKQDVWVPTLPNALLLLGTP